MSTQDELQALALTLAYEHASSVIDSECVPVWAEANEPDWFELPDKPVADIDDCVRYLELRGLIEKRKAPGGQRTWVRVADESEAER